MSYFKMYKVFLMFLFYLYILHCSEYQTYLQIQNATLDDYDGQ